MSKKDSYISWAIGFPIMGSVFIVLAIVSPGPSHFRGQLVEDWQDFVVGGIFVMIGAISALLAIKKKK